MNAHPTRAVRPKRRDYEPLESPDDLARMLLAYFAAYAAEAGINQVPMATTISISPLTASKVKGFRYIFSDPFGEVRHPVWPLPMPMWLAVDEAGNGFSYGNEGWSTLLTFKHLRKRSVEDLKKLLGSCDPFAEFYE